MRPMYTSINNDKIAFPQCSNATVVVVLFYDDAAVDGVEDSDDADVNDDQSSCIHLRSTRCVRDGLHEEYATILQFCILTHTSIYKI